MDNEIEKKRFKHPKTYYGNFILFTFFSLLGLFFIIDIILLTENQVHEDYFASKLYGNSKMRSTQMFLNFLIRNFGKKGVLILFIICFSIALWILITEIAEYRRYKHKCKLYQEGVIKNFFDIYDDAPSYSIFRWIRNIFRKKKSKYPSKKELKKSEKEMEGYFKNKR